MIKKFKEFINESIAIDSSVDINSLSIEDICKYLTDTYPKYRDPYHPQKTYPTSYKRTIIPQNDGTMIGIARQMDFIISNPRGPYECFLYFDSDEKKDAYVNGLKEICNMDEDNVESIDVIKVSPFDDAPVTLDFCVAVLDKIIELDPDNAVYIKA